jgi:tellurite resistance protein TerC
MTFNGIIAGQEHIFVWFLVLVLSLLALDLFLLRRHDETPSIKSSLAWSSFWLSIAFAFNIWIGWFFSWDAAATFLTGYIVELSLSVDNLFVFILIFAAFKIDPKYQHRVLFWGILGALVMRAICITAGVSALKRFEWLEFIFAAILIWAGLKTFFEKDQSPDSDPSKGVVAQLVEKVLPIDHSYVGPDFFVKKNGHLFGTPLLLVLVLVEISDVIFAVDSIPAVLAITQDSFLVYSSNIFAILGLRSMYFVLQRMVKKFEFLSTGVSIILVFIGIKMGVSRWYHVPTMVTLGIILTVIFGSVAISMAKDRKLQS